MIALVGGSQSSFPSQLREKKELWEMLSKVYQQQEALDQQKREAHSRRALNAS